LVSKSINERVSPSRLAVIDLSVLESSELLRPIKLTVLSTDALGYEKLSDPVSVRIGTYSDGAPVVAIETPARTVAVGGNTVVNSMPVLNRQSEVYVSVSSSDADGTVSEVSLFYNGAKLQTSTSAKLGDHYVFVIPSNTLPIGEGVLGAMSFDNDGNTTRAEAVTVKVENGRGVKPLVTLSTAAPSALKVGGSTLLSATATPGAGASILSVAFYVDGKLVSPADITAPYSQGYTPTEVGLHTFRVVVTDSLGNTSVSAEQSFTVTGNGAPSVSLVGPQGTAGTPFRAANNSAVSLVADADDIDGSIASVEFYANGSLIGTQNAPVIANRGRYVQTWTPSLAGTYTLTAIATDNLGATTTASVQTVGQDVIELAGPRVNLSESLNRVPGITVLNRQNYAQDLQLSIRGSGSR
jgi:hypothetical protein